jgi:hypothetical protein
MNLLLRICLFVVFIGAAISFYAMGQQAGAFVLVILGFCLEGFAWWFAFKKKSLKKTKPKEA